MMPENSQAFSYELLLGAVPNGWQVSQLSELCDIHDKKRVPLNSSDRKNRKGHFPYCGANGIVDYIDDYVFDGEYVLLAEDGGYWGKNEPSSYIMSGKFWVNNHAHILQANSNKSINQFLSYVLNYININPLIGGDARGKLTQSITKQLPIPHPSLPEQRSIAAALSKIQEAIAAQQEIIAQSVELKKALMDKFFTKGLRDEPTKETEVGPIPESWEFSTLGKLCSESGGRIQTGPFGSQLHSHEYEESGLPVVNPTHMSGNRINHQNIPKISIETAARLTRHELREGDILFARRGVIGRHGLVGNNEVGWICGTGCFLVRLNSERIINKFLSFFIATQPVVSWLNANAAGAIMPNLNSQVIGRIPVYFPPKPEQAQIVGLLTGLDDKVDAAVLKKEVLQDLFKTMLHELMTGNIRTTGLS